MKRISFLGVVSSRRSCTSSWNHSTSASLALLVGAYTWITVILLVCLGNEQRSFYHFQGAPKYHILDSFVDYDGYSFSSKGFLPTVVDIMVI